MFEEADAARKQWCALGSVKSQIGHTKCAAGVTGLLKAALALHHKTLPPTVKVNRPNENLAIDQSPFYLNTEARPWIRHPRHPRRASVSSFGFGGSNFHVTLEEYCGEARPAERFRPTPAELLVWCAKDPAQLRAAACRAGESADSGDVPLARLAYASQQRFDASLPARLAIVARDRGDLQHKLTQALESLARAPDGHISTRAGVYYRNAAATGRVAFVFAGQGSQYVNMGRDLALMFDAARQVWDRAAGVDLGTLPLHEVVFPHPAFSEAERRENERRIKQPQWSQPSIAACALSQLAVLEPLGIAADATAGHSFGELVALHAAGVFDAETLLRLACKRGELMDAATSGATSMTAVFAAPEKVAEFIARTDDAVIANLNSPSQTVISGSVRSLDAIEDALKEARVRCQRLPVGAAFHSPFMRPAAAALGDYLRTLDLRAPAMPVFACGSAEPYAADIRSIADALTEQLHQPVRFAETVRAMHTAGCTTFIELGPGSVLTGLVEEIFSGEPVHCIPVDRRGTHGVTQLWHALARLAVLGAPLDFSPLWESFGERPAETTAAAGAHCVEISGANYGRPYPPKPACATAPWTGGSDSGPDVRDSRREAETLRPGPGLSNGPAADPVLDTRAHPGEPGFWASQSAPEEALHAAAPACEVREDGCPPAAADGSGAAAERATGSDGALRRDGVPPGEGWSTASNPNAADNDAWLETLQQLERSTTAAEKAFQEALKQSYDAYLEAMHSAHAELERVRDARSAPKPGREQPLPRPQTAPGGAGADCWEEFDPLPVPAPPPRDDPPPPLPDNAVAEFGLGSSVPAQPSGIEETLLGIVAEKTGYAKELLDLDLELEGGLGIDSIKRVEIFSTLQRAVPGAANRLDPADLLKLGTLGDVLRALDGANGAGEAAASPHDGAQAPPPAAEPMHPARHPSQASLYRGEAGVIRVPPSGLAMAGLWTSNPLVLVASASEDEDFALRTAACLANLLQAAGLRAEVANEVTADARGAVLLDGLRPIANVRQGLEVNEAAFAAAAQFAARTARDREGIFVTVQDTGGSFGLADRPVIQPWAGGLAGLAKVAALEWPDIRTKAIDLEVAGRSPEAIARAVAAELLYGGPEQEVGIDREGRRTMPWVRARTAPRNTAWKLDRDAVVVVSGGARGVTADSVAALAARHPLRLVLLGRTALEPEPPWCTQFTDEPRITAAFMERARAQGTELLPIDARDAAQRILARRGIAANLARLEALGVEARYAAVDILDAPALRRVLEDVRRKWGPIRAVVHGAGIVHDRLIRDKSPEQFRRVMHTKVLGLHHLLEATREDPLSLLCVFSSIAARRGNAGQCDYAMANEILNKVAAAEREERGPDCRVRAINWGPWNGGMVTPELRARFTEAGVPLISVEDGANAFVAEALSDSDGAVEVIVLGNTAEGSLPDMGTAVPGTPLVHTADLRIDQERFPFLGDHCIQGCPVLPLVMVLEFFARMAHAVSPGMSLVRLRDVCVLSSLRLTGFATGCRLRISCRAGAPSAAHRSLEMELIGNDRQHVRAIADLGSAAPAADEAAVSSCPEAAPCVTHPDPYRDILFHGPAFQVLERVETFGLERARAELATTADKAWPGGPWLADPAALDGGLQLARIWAHARCGFKSLPMAVGEFSLHQPGKPIAACELCARSTSSMEARVDLVFLDALGKRVAGLRDVLMTMEPAPAPRAAS